jgi:hypothetical protein
MKEIDKISVHSPVKCGDVLLPDVLGTASTSWPVGICKKDPRHGECPWLRDIYSTNKRQRRRKASAVFCFMWMPRSFSGTQSGSSLEMPLPKSKNLFYSFLFFPGGRPDLKKRGRLRAGMKNHFPQAPAFSKNPARCRNPAHFPAAMPPEKQTPHSSISVPRRRYSRKAASSWPKRRRQETYSQTR